MTCLASTRVLLEGAVDYAGTFPPAGLSLRDAAATYIRARETAEAWLLGRMVVHESHLEQLVAELPSWTGLKACATDVRMATPVDVTVVMGAGATPDIARLAGYNEQWDGRARIVSVEFPPANVEDIRRIADQVSRYGGSGKQDPPYVPSRDGGSKEQDPPYVPQDPGWHRASALSVDMFFETPLDDTLESRLDAIASAGGCAKVRTGGTAAPAIPAPQALARFLRACTDRGLCFKATAGLHHAIRSCYSLTYERDSATAVMHGFLNVSIAAALAREAASVSDLTDALSEPSAAAFEFREDGVAYRGSLVPLEQIVATRRQAFRSFGSCSFREPVEELARLRLV